MPLKHNLIDGDNLRLGQNLIEVFSVMKKYAEIAHNYHVGINKVQVYFITLHILTDINRFNQYLNSGPFGIVGFFMQDDSAVLIDYIDFMFGIEHKTRTVWSKRI